MPVIKPEVRYSDRLNKVINFAHANSQWNVQLDQLADIACLSKYHFIRVFHDQIGETPVSFIKRIRLERAARILRNEPDLSIKEIAFNCGFASNQLFSRKFGNWFGRCPSEYRTNHFNYLENSNQHHQLLEMLPATTLNLESNIEEAARKIDIKALPATRIAYVRSIGRYGVCENIDLAVDTIINWARSQNIWTDHSDLIGASWDSPAITPDGKCRFDACMTLPQEYTDRSGISQQIFPGGLYATMKFTNLESHDFPALWQWFSLTLGNAKKFKPFKLDLTIGPWFESHQLTDNNGEHSITLYMRLELSNEPHC